MPNKGCRIILWLIIYAVGKRGEVILIDIELFRY